jgi:hypothetical protein
MAFGVRPYDFDFRLNGLDFKPSSFDFRPNGLDFSANGLDFRPNGLDLKASSLDLRASGVDFKSSDFDFRANGLDFRANGLDFRASTLTARPNELSPAHGCTRSRAPPVSKAYAQSIETTENIKEVLMTEITINPNPHVEAANALLEKIRALRADVPGFITEAPARERIRITRRASVPTDFLESASVVVRRSARLETAAGSDAARVRDSYAYSLAYEAVIQELNAFSRSVRYTIRVRRAEAGGSALDVFAVARRLAKQKDGAELIPHVEDMQRKLKRKRTRKTTSDPVPAPVDLPATKSKA